MHSVYKTILIAYILNIPKGRSNEPHQYDESQVKAQSLCVHPVLVPLAWIDRTTVHAGESEWFTIYPESPFSHMDRNPRPTYHSSGTHSHRNLFH